MSTRNCSAAILRGRLRKANGFFQAAQDVSALDDSGEAHDAVVTLYVHAGIAAADVICCARLGKHSSGDNHAEAIALLETVSRSHRLSRPLGGACLAAHLLHRVRRHGSQD